MLTIQALPYFFSGCRLYYGVRHYRICSNARSYSNWRICQHHYSSSCCESNRYSQVSVIRTRLSPTVHLYYFNMSGADRAPIRNVWFIRKSGRAKPILIIRNSARLIQVLTLISVRLDVSRHRPISVGGESKPRPHLVHRNRISLRKGPLLQASVVLNKKST